MTVTFALTEMQKRQLAENAARLDVPGGRRVLQLTDAMAAIVIAPVSIACARIATE